MASRETRPISERRTDVSSGRDIARRLLFLFVIVGGAGGVIGVLYGLTRSRLPFGIGGGLLLLAALLAGWRTRCALASTSAEIKQNPFNPKHEPNE